MTRPIIRHLATLFEAAQNVKLSTDRLDPVLIYRPHEADLVVHTWMGGRLYVYLVEKPPKVRDLRATLRENSRCGIGTLYLVEDALLPRHGERTPLKEWQLALQALGDGWITVYHLEAAPLVSQMQFSPAVKAGEFDCWHFTGLEIETVSIRRQMIKDPLKGDWVIGDIASPMYRRRINYERQHQHFHYSTKSTREVMIAPLDQLMAYYELLEIERSASEQEVKAAYRRMAMKLHPDVSEFPKEEAEQRFRDLNVAYEFIKKYHDWA